MRDALGGTVTIAIILVFIALVSAYMAFNVNYTKAFRMKNKIINLYEKYYGKCFQNQESKCKSEISQYAKEIGYNPQEINCPDISGSVKYYDTENKYCVYKFSVSDNTIEYKDKGDLYYYKVYTIIDIKFPIINNLLGNLRVFQTTGDTKVLDLNAYNSRNYSTVGVS